MDPKVDDSIVFLNEKKIETKSLETAVKYEFTYEKQLQLINSAIERLPMDCRHHVKLARAVLIRDYEGVDTFRKELLKLDAETSNLVQDPHWLLYRSKFNDIF